MEKEFQLFTIETVDRAGVITAIAAWLASRGVNIECFLATDFGGEAGRRQGKFVAIIEADQAYAIVLKKGLKCLEVVLDVSEPTALDAGEANAWRTEFARLTEKCQSATSGTSAAR